MKKLKVGIIGLGIGVEHIDAYLQMPECFEISMLCDLDRSKTEKQCKRTGAAGTSSLADVLSCADVDIIDICLPPQLHKEAILQALGADKHVICEKPLVGSLRDADEIATASIESRGHVFPVFQYRFGTGLQQLRRLQSDGVTGKPLVATVETHWNRQSDYYQVDWRGKWKTELGGALVAHAIHSHDLLCWVMGPVIACQAMLDTRVNEIEVEDCAALALKTASGALCTSSVTLGNSCDQSRFRFVFRGLSAESSLDPYNPARTPWKFVARGDTRQADIDTIVGSVAEEKEGYAGLFADIHNSIITGQPARVELMDARRSLELVTALYDAARNEASVKLPLAENHSGYGGWLRLNGVG